MGPSTVLIKDEVLQRFIVIAPVNCTGHRRTGMVVDKVRLRRRQQDAKHLHRCRCTNREPDRLR